MQGLEATVKLTLVAELAEILPHIFDGDVEGSLEEVVGNLRAAIGEPFSFPVGRVKQHLFFCHLTCDEAGTVVASAHIRMTAPIA